MAALRHRLRALAAVWLIWQLTALTAIVPFDCCAGHSAAERRCTPAAPAVQCPMRGADGQPCPMHRADSSAAAEHAGHHQEDAPAQPSSPCRMSGTCRGPLAAFLATIINQAILSDETAALVAEGSDRVRIPDDRPIQRLALPDTPPPRS